MCLFLAKARPLPWHTRNITWHIIWPDKYMIDKRCVRLTSFRRFVSSAPATYLKCSNLRTKWNRRSLYMLKNVSDVSSRFEIVNLTLFQVPEPIDIPHVDFLKATLSACKSKKFYLVFPEPCKLAIVLSEAIITSNIPDTMVPLFQMAEIYDEFRVRIKFVFDQPC